MKKSKKKTTPPGEHPVPMRKKSRISEHKFETYEVECIPGKHAVQKEKKRGKSQKR